MESVSQDIKLVMGWNRILVLITTIVWRFHFNDDRLLSVLRMRRRLLSFPDTGFWLTSWNNAVMGLAGILRQESLEDVAETPRVVVSPIWTMKVDAIIASPIWVSIEVLLEHCGKIMGSNTYLSSDITSSKNISDDSVAIF